MISLGTLFSQGEQVGMSTYELLSDDAIPLIALWSELVAQMLQLLFAFFLSAL
jgi:hypothetical protein